MKRMRRAFLLLGAVLCCCVGCGKNDSDSTANLEKTEQKNPVEEGYHEKEIGYPDGQVFYCENTEKQEPCVYMFDSSGNAGYRRYVYRQEIWEQESFDAVNKLLEKNNLKTLYSVHTLADGKVYGVGIDNKSDSVQSFKFYEFAKSQIKTGEDLTEKDGAVLYGYQLLENQKIACFYDNRNVCIRNLHTGKTIKDFGYDFTSMTVIGQNLYAINEACNQIVIYDIDTAEVSEKYSVDITDQGIVFAEDDAYNRYACTENGIFLLGDNGKIEQVMDGKNMSTNAYTNSARLDFMCAKDGVFYVNYLISGDNQRKYRLCSYSK